MRRQASQLSRVSRIRGVTTSLVALMLVALVGCGDNGTAGDASDEETDAAETSTDAGGEEASAGCDDEVRLVFGLVEPLTAPSGVLAESFAEVVQETSDGRITVDVVPASQLGAPLEQIEALRGGSQDLLAFDKGFNGEYVDDYAAFEIPFLIENGEALLNVLSSDVGDRLRSELRDQGLVTLSDMFLVAPRIVFTTVEATEIADFEGMRFRVPEIDTYFDTWSAIGISPTPIPWGEIYLSLQQGVIDGGEGPLVAVEANSFTEVADYVIETNHLYSTNNILMSAEVFDALCSSDQALLMSAAEDIVDENNARLADDLEASKRVMTEEHGSTILQPSDELIEELRSRSLAAGEELESQGRWSEGLLDEIRANQ